MPKKIILVRHGETLHNREKRLMNWQSDVGLSDRGKEEAAIVGERLKSMSINAMYVSDLRRTRETGNIIASRTGHNPIYTEYLRERNLGKFGDHTFDEIKSLWPGELEIFLDHTNTTWNGLEGESLAQVHARFKKFLGHLEVEHQEETVLLVTHSGFLYINLQDVLELVPKNTWMDVEHTSITTIVKEGNKYIMESFNKTD